MLVVTTHRALNQVQMVFSPANGAIQPVGQRHGSNPPELALSFRRAAEAFPRRVPRSLGKVSQSGGVADNAIDPLSQLTN